MVKYNLKNQANITRILKSRNKIISHYESGKFENSSKHLKGAKYSELDKKFIKFISDAKKNDIPLTLPFILETAKQFANDLNIQKNIE